MSKRKTVGERIAQKFWGSSWRTYDVDDYAKLIDRAIRRAQAKAWDEGAMMYAQYCNPKPFNPYRGRAKR